MIDGTRGAAGSDLAFDSERVPASSRKRLLHALGLALVQALGFFVVGQAVLAPRLLGDADPFGASPRAFGLFAALAAVDIALVVWLGLVRVGRVGLEDLGWRRSPARRSVALGAAGLVVCAGVTFAFWLSSDPSRAPVDFFRAVGDASTAQRALFVLIGLQAAFVEETLFRGYLQRILVARRGAWVGVVVTAAIFAVYHLNFRPTALLAKFVFGLVFGALRELDRSLWAPAIAHAALWAVIGAI